MAKVTIELDDELIKFIKETAHNLKTQDSRHTDTPIYRIYEKTKVERQEGNGDHAERYQYEGAEDNYCDTCKEILEENNHDFEKLPPLDDDDCDCRYEGAVFFYDETLAPAEGGYDGVGFLTESAAEEYRENNHYHFTEGGVVYAESAFRNWELKGVIDVLTKIGEQLNGQS